MAIPQYSAVNGPFVSPDGRLTFAGNVFLRELWLRGGGSIAPSNDELLLSEYADAGIEELKATVYALADELRSLPPVVQLPAVASSGATWTETEIDFGALPVYSASFTIADGGISAISKVQVLPCGKAATGRTADDWEWDGATFAANPGAGSATCYAVFTPGPIVGRRKIQYSIGA
jgi:hypothetical protein